MANQKVGIGHTDSDLELTLQERGSVVTAAVEIVNADGDQVNLGSGLVPENFDHIDLLSNGWSNSSCTIPRLMKTTLSLNSSPEIKSSGFGS